MCAVGANRPYLYDTRSALRRLLHVRRNPAILHCNAHLVLVRCFRWAVRTTFVRRRRRWGRIPGFKWERTACKVVHGTAGDTMIEHIVSVQALVVGLVFAWAGIWKVCFPQARALAARSALGKFLPKPGLAQAAYFTLGIAEICTATLLLLPPARSWAIRLATVFTLGFLGYLWLAWRVAPEKPCACLGAGSLLMLTIIGWPAQEYWAAALFRAPWAALLIAAEMVALWLLSPEFGWVGMRLAQRLTRAARLRLNPTCAGILLNWTDLERDLRQSPAFRELAPHLSAISDRWREGCWGYIAYRASYADRQATAVFSVPALFDSSEVSAAVVDDADNSILLRLTSAHSAGVAR